VNVVRLEATARRTSYVPTIGRDNMANERAKRERQWCHLDPEIVYGNRRWKNNEPLLTYYVCRM
jgi:hypothetical protein